MKKILVLVLFALFTFSAFSQDKLFFHFDDGNVAGISFSIIDSLFFDDISDLTVLKLKDTTVNFQNSVIDSITFGIDDNQIIINYLNDKVTVKNPYIFEGVTITSDGAKVVVSSAYTKSKLNYHVKGNSSNGYLKIYSDKDFGLTLNNLELVNPVGPVINIQSKVNTNLNLIATNVLTDGAKYSDAPLKADGKSEDQNAAFFTEGNLNITGDGSITINGLGEKKHGLNSDGFIIIDDGIVEINSAAKDGIHSSNGLVINNGSIDITAKGDGIDGDASFITINGGKIHINSNEDDTKGIACDSTLTISGGEISVISEGKQSKAIKSDSDIIVNGGIISIISKGGVVLEASGSGYDPSYSTGMKSGKNLNINGGSINISSTGIAGKGLSSDSDININGGNIIITTSGNGAKYVNATGTNDNYNATCITTDGNLNIMNGNITLTSSGSASKGISTDGYLNIGSDFDVPILNVTTTGAKILMSGSGQNAEYAESKTIKSDGSLIINNGNLTISSADDGLKSEKELIINNGTINIIKSVEGIESPYITLNGGNVNVTASDDALNATKGNGGESNDGSLLLISGGYNVIDASGGDGLDSNGDLKITGGTTIVHGPQSQPEVGVDVNGTFNIDGGFLVVSSPNSNMLEDPSGTSLQNTILIKSGTGLSSATLFHIQDQTGNDIVTFQPKRTYSAIYISTPSIINGNNYSIYTGGSSTGTNNYGLYSGGIYSGGTLKKSVTVSSKITKVNL